MATYYKKIAAYGLPAIAIRPAECRHKPVCMNILYNCLQLPCNGLQNETD